MSRSTRLWKPIIKNLMTKWSEDISPENPLFEYPRPQMRRERWLNLNGLWEYAVRSKDVTDIDSSYDGNILVPFAIESALSGVGIKLHPNERLWYRRNFFIPSEWKNQKILLHFGAVDWETSVFINGFEFKIHRGGYTPFSFEISAYLHRDGANEIIVVVWDPTDEGLQERGKQKLEPEGIWYTSVSGIWQTVWIEPVPKISIKSIKMRTDIEKGELHLTPEIENYGDGLIIHTAVFKENIEISEAENEAGHELVITIPNPELWTPNDPHLYDITISLKKEDEILDEVDSYFGMRKIELMKDEQGIMRITLNNEPIFMYGLLDQGWWPDGLYTAPTDEALKYDIEKTKELGFNMIRKHVKIEPARWYYHCDQLGILVWQDMPNGGTVTAQRNEKNIIYGNGRDDKSVRKNYYDILGSMVKHLYNHPCIVVWVPFNEAWGQFETSKVTDVIRKLDSTRLIESASGWFDQKTGDIRSYHDYSGPKMPKLEKNRAVALTEFGGLGLVLKNHLWIEKKSWGYRNMKNKKILMDSYLEIAEKLPNLIKKGLCAAIYTQTTDVEGEVNGFMTYDRKVLKFDAEKLKKIHFTLVNSL